MRLILGLVKGAAVGGGVGYGAYAAGLTGGFHWITYGLIGALVGLLAGRPIWSHLADKSSTVWTAVLKGIFGFGVAVGMYAIVAKAWGGFKFGLAGEPAQYVYDWQFIFGGAIGALWGAFVEMDDAPAKEKAKSKDA